MYNKQHEAAKDAVRQARVAWWKAIDARDVKWTPAAHAAECRTIDKLERAIKALQGFDPNYDPRATVFYANNV